MRKINILGISGWKDLQKVLPNTQSLPLHDAASTLIIDGTISGIAEEERFTRLKHSYNTFPLNAAAYCLSNAGLTLDDIDLVAVYWDMPYSARLKGENWRYTNREILDLIFPREIFGHKQEPKVEFVNHHFAHAVSAYSCSNFEKALVLVLDGQGENASTTIWVGENGHLTKLREMDSAVSLGYFYESLTEYIGLESNEPGKTMGLAPYGKPFLNASDFFKIEDGLIRLLHPATINMKSEFDEQKQVREYWFRQFAQIIAKPNKSMTQYDVRTAQLSRLVGFDEAYVNLAASGQKILEEVVLQLIEWGIENTGIDRVCIAGGVGLNCVMNGKILSSPKVRELFIQPIAHDAGAALGSAISVCDEWKKQFSHIYLGPEFNHSEIESMLKEFKLKYDFAGDIEERIAEKLSEGFLVGWFQGRMEVGPRALGNRSILANPVLPDAKDRVNKYVKFRENWRPFAPSILEEYKEDFLVKAVSSPYMILNFEVPAESRDKLKGVIHVDGTIRAQTVSKNVNPRYWKMINHVYKKTGVPAVLNTSFNIKGEPIVCTPRDAVRTFFSCGLDYLAIENYLIQKV